MRNAEKRLKLYVISSPLVLFRIIPVKPNLLPVHGSMDVYVLDNTGMPIRRWLDQQTNAGKIFSNTFSSH